MPWAPWAHMCSINQSANLLHVPVRRVVCVLISISASKQKVCVIAWISSPLADCGLHQLDPKSSEKGAQPVECGFLAPSCRIGIQVVSASIYFPDFSILFAWTLPFPRSSRMASQSRWADSLGRSNIPTLATLSTSFIRPGHVHVGVARVCTVYCVYLVIW